LASSTINNPCLPTTTIVNHIPALPLTTVEWPPPAVIVAAHYRHHTPPSPTAHHLHQPLTTTTAHPNDNKVATPRH
jgi:hypothetical protein